MVLNRYVIAVLIVFGLVALAAPRVGEPDRRESWAIGAARAIVSAESAYAAAHGGRFATLDCLQEPACASSTRASGPVLPPDLIATREHDEYRLEFYPGPASAADQDPRRALTRFAVVAMPATDETRGRAFCADDRGVMYVIEVSTVPRVEHGRCLDTRSTVAAR